MTFSFFWTIKDWPWLSLRIQVELIWSMWEANAINLPWANLPWGPHQKARETNPAKGPREKDSVGGPLGRWPGSNDVFQFVHGVSTWVYLDMVCSTSKKVGISWDIRGIMIRIMGIKQDIEPTIVQFGCVWNWGIAPKGNFVINHHIWADSFFSDILSMKYCLIGGSEHFLWLSIQLGISYSQLTFTPSFFRGVGWNHQPVIVIFHRWDNLIDNPKWRNFQRGRLVNHQPDIDNIYISTI